MAKIIPFRGVHYAPAAGELAKLVCPPYDVISSDEQDALCSRDPHNYVRVILNRPEPDDDGEDAAYRRAGETLRDWLASGILSRDDAPSLYLYSQSFTHPTTGSRQERQGFFCALRLEPYSSGIVLPHEETRPKVKADRLKLMRAAAANPEPIYALYEDPENSLGTMLAVSVKHRPAELYADIAGDHHSVWRIDDPQLIASIAGSFRDHRIWIADGHHRYETALTYRDERRAAEETAESPRAYDYVLAVLSSFTDPGLAVLPTHRLVKDVAESRLDQLRLALGRYFAVFPAADDRIPEGMAGPGHRIGMVDGDGAWILALRDEEIMDAAVEGHASAWKRLDVAILQALVLERSLGIPASALAASAGIGYTRSRSDAIQRVRSGEYQLAFILNDPTADEIRQVAAAGDRMPAKSTYFYPKLWSGLILRTIDEGP